MGASQDGDLRWVFDLGLTQGTILGRVLPAFERGLVAKYERWHGRLFILQVLFHLYKTLVHLHAVVEVGACLGVADDSFGRCKVLFLLVPIACTLTLLI